MTHGRHKSSLTLEVQPSGKMQSKVQDKFKISARDIKQCNFKMLRRKRYHHRDSTSELYMEQGHKVKSQP